MTKISAVYKIVNTVTKDFYIGSSKDVKCRWAHHKCPYIWGKCPNSPMYQDMQKYGLDEFRFQILAPVEPKYLKQVEQEFIDMLHPTYNNNNAKGWDVERYKESIRKYQQSDKQKEYQKIYRKEHLHQLCSYNGETLTLNALTQRLHKTGVEHPYLEAKKYLLI